MELYRNLYNKHYDGCRNGHGMEWDMGIRYYGRLQETRRKIGMKVHI